MHSFKAVLLVLLAVIAPAVAAAEPAPPIIPKPRTMQTCSGAFTLDRATALVAPEDARASEIAGLLREAIAHRTGITLADVDSGNARRAIELRHDDSVRGEEAYRLDVGADRVVIAASSDRGLLWGVQTLRQLLPSQDGGKVTLPCLHIEDAPALAYRGQMLDVSRHFFPVEFIKRQLDVLSYYKINTFRWHLTDDQGWRIQIKRYPKLTEVAAWRRERDGSRHGGFYTREQVREVVEYARRRGIMVIPEIEMPGHATAALVAYPELACGKAPKTVPNTWGVHKDIFCAGKEQTFEFLENVLDEVIALFPAPYLHIGGDEAPKDRWQACESCQALMRREGLKDEHELQSWFVRRIQRHLHDKGRTLVGWDEILEGGADRKAVIEVWRGEAEGRKALANGNRIINASPYYINTALDELTLQETYGRDPLEGYRAQRAQVWGAEAPLWTEYITPLNAEAMLYPRMLAFAEITWSEAPRDYADFHHRLQAHYPWLAAHGVAYGPEDAQLAEYTLGFDRVREHWQLDARYGFDDMRSHYTLDGKTPTASAPAFDARVAIDRPGTLRVVPFRGERQTKEALAYTLVSHHALGAQVRQATPPKQPKAQGETVLVDGILGGDNFSDGTWAGWQRAEMDVVVDLGEPRTLRSVAVNFLQASGSWILLPRKVTYSVSDDGSHWRTLHTATPAIEPLQSAQFVERISYQSPQPLQARWLRVQAQPYGPLPAPHAGAGHQAWVFADEIVVE